ncbi:MAG TPA: SPFH domain-containing protein [Planctomycetota bacterium]|nr:SPFH domain-containing protein [Planctomycetota bacterium]
MAESGGKGGCIATGIVVGVAVLLFTLWTCAVKVPADRIGVRRVNSGTGVEEKDYGPGYVLQIPGLHVVTLWDPTWTNLKETMQVRGSDQYTTTVDVSVVFRIEPQKCHEVAKNFPDEARVEQRVRNAMNKFANEILAQMKTEDFFDTKVREAKAREAQKAMDETLRPIGIEVRYVLLRNILYDPKFEAQLLRKQLAGQQKSLEIAKGQLAGAQTQTELIRRNAEAEVKRIDESKRQEIENLNADTDRKIAQLTQDAKQKAAAILNKAESSKRQKIAQADLIKATASAAGTAAMSRVYAKPGASYYFARQAVEGMKLGEIEVNSTTFNPLDSDRLLKALGLDLRSASVPAVPLPPAPAPQK